VLDFGISKVRSASTKLTRTSSVMGTPDYMSPEQARGHIEDIDERTDQWALACIVWECLSGEGPFVAENVPSILFQIVHEPPAPLLPRVAGLPSQVEEVLLRALAKDKNERFASVSDFALALERAGGAAVSTVVGRPEMLARPEQVPDSAPAKSTTFSHTAGELDALTIPRARLKWTWVLAAGAALGLVLAAFLFSAQGQPQEPSSPVRRRLPWRRRLHLHQRRRPGQNRRRARAQRAGDQVRTTRP